MAHFPYLDWLARHYKHKAENCGNWTDYVKVRKITMSMGKHETHNQRAKLHTPVVIIQPRKLLAKIKLHNIEQHLQVNID